LERGRWTRNGRLVMPSPSTAGLQPSKPGPSRDKHCVSWRHIDGTGILLSDIVWYWYLHCKYRVPGRLSKIM
jgi:hypothetical protein